MPDFFINPQAGQRLREFFEKIMSRSGGWPKYARSLPSPEGRVPERLPYFSLSQVVREPELGVRAFARRHGVEHLLEFDPATMKVTLGGEEVPYHIIYHGRAFAPSSVLYAALRRLKAKGLVR